MTAWVLLLLDTGASYGYDLRRELGAHELNIDASVLYRSLRKLEREGWVESRWMKSASGPKRRFYRLTAKGRRRLNDVAALIVEIRDLNDMFVVAHKRAMARRDDRPREDAGAQP